MEEKKIDAPEMLMEEPTTTKDPCTAPRPFRIHIIHHNDADGKCAAAIVLRYYAPRMSFPPERISLYSVNYNIPVDVSQMAPDDLVIIVDFSYAPDEMKKIEEALADKATGNIIWIDHHKTAERYGYAYEGLRDFTNKGRSGCELTWQHFLGVEPAPPVVTLIGDYDAWRLKNPDSIAFHEGIKLFCSEVSDPLWAPLLDSNPDVFNLVLAGGQIALQYRTVYCAGIRRDFGYETVFSGHLAYAMNVFGFGSGAFGDIFNQYPLVIAYIHDGTKFTVSLYSETVDVGEIALAHGGGGHKGAAGFVCSILPFYPVKGDSI